MNRHEQYRAAKATKPGKIKPLGKSSTTYLIPYEYGHSDNASYLDGICTGRQPVWWVRIDGETPRAMEDPNQTPFTIEDLDI